MSERERRGPVSRVGKMLFVFVRTFDYWPLWGEAYRQRASAPDLVLRGWETVDDSGHAELF